MLVNRKQMFATSFVSEPQAHQKIAYPKIYDDLNWKRWIVGHQLRDV
jgi:hypothetical protein